jgi:dienelactone hydrolase
VSLGFFEREDLKAVIHFLRASKRVSTVALWGRSMGAATALMHGDRDPSIAAMILDSPFADLTQLAEEMVDKGREHGLVVPGFVVSIAISFLRGSVKKNAGFNIKDISPIKRVDQCFIPALFVAGEGDDFINPRHSHMIHAKYSGDKNMVGAYCSFLVDFMYTPFWPSQSPPCTHQVMVEGDHNSPRPRFLYDSAANFLQMYLQISPEWALKDADPFNGGYPPWVSRGVFTMRPNLEFEAELEEEDDGTEEGGQGTVDLNDGSHLGMTTERQVQTQQALLSMLGGGGGGGGGTCRAAQTGKVLSASHGAAPATYAQWPCGVVRLNL